MSLLFSLFVTSGRPDTDEGGKNDCSVSDWFRVSTLFFCPGKENLKQALRMFSFSKHSPGFEKRESQSDSYT